MQSSKSSRLVWYGIVVEFNVPLNTVIMIGILHVLWLQLSPPPQQQTNTQLFLQIECPSCRPTNSGLWSPEHSHNQAPLHTLENVSVGFAVYLRCVKKPTVTQLKPTVSITILLSPGPQKQHLRGLPQHGIYTDRILDVLRVVNQQYQSIQGITVEEMG